MRVENASDDEDLDGGGSLARYPAILWQRRWLIILPALLIAAAGIAAAFLLPTTYRSTATLVVEAQELPEDLVGSPVTSLIDQRIAKIRQQVMSRGDLIELIHLNNLYPEERQSRPLSKVIEKMRKRTSVNAVSADIGQQTGATSTIAFEVSFDYSDPVKAQLVVQSFVDRFVQSNSRQTERQAENTVAFLSAQAADLQQQLADIEGQITDIKARNGSALVSMGIPTLTTSGSYDAQIAALQRDNALAAQQARVVVRDPNVAAAEARLAAARATYSESHPDVSLAKRQLAEAQRLASANQTDQAGSIAAAQIASNNAQIAALGRLRSEEAARSSSISSAQARAPLVMEQVAQLESRAKALREQHQAIATRLLNAQNSARMETEDKGERLSVSDPPVVPDRPLSPNRLLLIAGGIVGGLAAGFMLAMLAEMLLRPIRGVAQIEQLLGTGPLVVIPTFEKNITRARSPRHPFFGRLFSRRRKAFHE